MALIGFDDRSYIELIAVLREGAASPWWCQHISRDGGPCAWAALTDDHACEATRLHELGMPVDVPTTYYYRKIPDGQFVEWGFAVVVDQCIGAVLPFLISVAAQFGGRLALFDGQPLALASPLVRANKLHRELARPR